VIAPAPVTAEPDPKGGAIRLAWTNPQIPNFAGTRLLRRESVWPKVPDDMKTRAIHDDTGTPAGADGEFLDTGLRDEVTYYYAVVSYDQAGGTFPAFVAAMSTAPYGIGQYLYDNLPGIYQSYDTARPPPSPTLDPADLDKGQLQRFVEMFGLQFDLLRSHASGMRSFFDPDTIDGSLLPVLGGWIGWQTDFTLDLLKQRNQIRYAPHYHATAGIAANVRATINRLATWDVRIKEFAQNIFLSNVPEQFPIWQQERTGSVWQPAAPVTLDVAYEGRPSAVQSRDGRLWLFYHARESSPAANGALITAGASDRLHLRYKTFDQGDWLPARRLTMTLPVAVGSSTNRAPAAVLRSDGTFWIFWSSLDSSAQVSQLRAARMAAGRAALSARIQGTRAAPFVLADGDTVQINIGTPQPLVRNVVFRNEDFFNIAQAAAFEVAAVLDRELPGVNVTAAQDGTLVLVTQTAGPGSLLTVPASAGAAKLGLASAPAAAGATAATLTGAIMEPFALSENDTLVLTIDRDVPRVVTFSGSGFRNIAQATASEVAAATNAVIPQAASVAGGKLQIQSLSPGADSMVLLDLSLSTAAAKLGLGQAPPSTPSGIDETEPTAFEDPSGNLWLFWASRRDGGWRIWYDRLAASAGWGTPKPLTSSPLPEREPSALFDPQGGRIWVAWSRRKASGFWNIFFGGNTTTDFNVQASGGWPETELTVPASTFDNREPALALTAPGSLELFFSSNRADGWNIWSRSVTTTTQAADAAATSGQFSRRGAAPLQTADGRMQLWFRNNETMKYTSALYPIAQTIDSRYAGSTAADTRNRAKLSLRNDIEGIQHYTYETPLPDTDEENRRLYSRDTIALYLTPDTQDEQLIVRSRAVIASVLKSFLPAQTRAVILIDQAFEDFVYTYDAPAGVTPHLIGDEMIDTVLSEVVAPFAESATASVNFRFLRTWAPNSQSGQLPDLRVVPPDLSFRLLLPNVQEQS
jgi:phage tail-like protein